MRAYFILRAFLRQQGGHTFTYDDIEGYMWARYADPMPKLVDRMLRCRCVRTDGEGIYSAWPVCIYWRRIFFWLAYIGGYLSICWAIWGR